MRLANALELMMWSSLALVVVSCDDGCDGCEDRCWGGCEDNEVCASGTCRSHGVVAHMFCEHSTTLPAPGFCGADLACTAATSNGDACCPPGYPYMCELSFCFPTAEEAQRQCPRACIACAGTPEPERCGPGTAQCDGIGACCPCDQPYFYCGNCFARPDDGQYHCGTSGVRTSEGHAIAMCRC